MPLSHSTRFDELKATNQLPSPTGVALAILRLGESEKTTSQEIARILQTDPALSGRILKIANSAAFAGRVRPATSVREAVTYLGARMVRNVALGFSLVSQSGRSSCRAFDYPGFWSRSLAMAVAAQAAAHHTGHISPAEAFTCGLLAQVGRLALASIYPDDYGAILDRVGGASPATLCRLEREQFATDHNELTAALLRDWGLPEVCVVAAQHHEVPEHSGLAESERAQALARLLRLASRMAGVCVADGDSLSARVFALLVEGQELGIPTHELARVCDGAVAEWQDWGALLEVVTRTVPSFAELTDLARKEAGSPARPEEPAAVGGAGTLAGEAEEQMVGAAAGGPLSVVVVDDDPVELRLLTRHLMKAGHAVQSAPDGETALRLVLEVNPHLVITDWVMPGMDGTALVRALRQTKMGRSLYILLLTGSEGDEAQVEAFEAGADDYVVKPFRPRLLAARLRACARVVRLQDEVRRDKEELRRCMAELGVANRKLQHAALTDALTGLFNRRYAMGRLEQEWSLATRTGQPLACLVLDIDHFKRVNDTHGHDVGDRVLQATANVLRGTLRLSDVVCRIGGEEFVMFGAGMDRHMAAVCAERLRAAVEAHLFETPSGRLPVTVSIGVAVRTERMAGPTELLKAADQAVYAAKEAGRNQVCFAPAS